MENHYKNIRNKFNDKKAPIDTDSLWNDIASDDRFPKPKRKKWRLFILLSILCLGAFSSYFLINYHVIIESKNSIHESQDVKNNTLSITLNDDPAIQNEHNIDTGNKIENSTSNFKTHNNVKTKKKTINKSTTYYPTKNKIKNIQNSPNNTSVIPLEYTTPNSITKSNNPLNSNTESRHSISSNILSDVHLNQTLSNIPPLSKQSATTLPETTNTFFEENENTNLLPTLDPTQTINQEIEFEKIFSILADTLPLPKKSSPLKKGKITKENKWSVDFQSAFVFLRPEINLSGISDSIFLDGEFRMKNTTSNKYGFSNRIEIKRNLKNYGNLNVGVELVSWKENFFYINPDSLIQDSIIIIDETPFEFKIKNQLLQLLISYDMTIPIGGSIALEPKVGVGMNIYHGIKGESITSDLNTYNLSSIDYQKKFGMTFLSELKILYPIKDNFSIYASGGIRTKMNLVQKNGSFKYNISPIHIGLGARFTFQPNKEPSRH